MMNAKSAPKSNETTWLWLIKIVTGLLVIILLLVHFVVNHFLADGALLSYDDVIAYFSNAFNERSLFNSFIVSLERPDFLISESIILPLRRRASSSPASVN